MKPSPNTPKSNIEQRDKKPYSSPQVTLYGNIRELTQNVGPNGMTDGGTFKGGKTSP
jgi:hypothetical protein